MHVKFNILTTCQVLVTPKIRSSHLRPCSRQDGLGEGRTFSKRVHSRLCRSRLNEGASAAQGGEEAPQAHPIPSLMFVFPQGHYLCTAT